MPSAEDFYARVLAHTDPDGRLPMPAQSMWEIFPFELDGLRVKPLDPLTLPEPPRGGEAGLDEQGRGCWRCEAGDSDAVWSDERWVLTGWGEPLGLPVGLMLSPREHRDLSDLGDDLAAELGVLTVRVVRAVEGLGERIGRVHVNKWGDGGAHLHLCILARPAGLLQLRGSNLPLWEEMLPRVPEDEAAADLAAVAAELAAWRGRAH